MLNVPGSDLKNIFYLRSVNDAQAIAKAGAGKRVVIIGSSFIGKFFFSKCFCHVLNILVTRETFVSHLLCSFFQ
jgi:hypothetical protein